MSKFDMRFKWLEDKHVNKKHKRWQKGTRAAKLDGWGEEKPLTTRKKPVQ